MASKSSLSKLKIAFLDPLASEHTSTRRLSQRHPSPAPRRDSVLIAHRPAPLPPTLRVPSPDRFAPSTNRAPSPALSATPAHSRTATRLGGHTPIQPMAGVNGYANGVSPARSSVWAKDDGLVEIPRFKKRELNLGIIAGSRWQRIAWVCLWAGWILWGLLSLVSHQILHRSSRIVS